MRDILIEEYGEEFFKSHFKMWMELFERIYTVRKGELCSKRLHKITSPTLILQGTHDGMIKMKQAEFLRDSIKDSRYLGIQTCDNQ